jgi:hypothetical protein
VDNDPLSTSVGSVYVAEAGNARVQKFSPSGQFVWMNGGGVNDTTGGNLCTAASGDLCGRGSAGTGESEFAFSSSPRIGAIAVGPGGVLHAVDRKGEEGRVQRFNGDGVIAKSTVLLPAPGRPLAIGVDSESNFYVGNSGESGAIRKYDEDGICLNCANPINPSFNINALTVDSADNLYVGDNTFTRSAILLFNAAGVQQRTFYGNLDSESSVVGLAPYGENVFAAERSGQERVVEVSIPPPGPLVYPEPSTVFANPVRSTNAMLHAEINPEGEPTTFHFEYVDQSSFEAGGWASQNVAKTAESSVIGSSFTLLPEEQKATGLAPETAYIFRAVATNAAGSNAGPEGTFVTSESVEFLDAWSTGVKSKSAILHTEVNPLGSPATGYFEYVDDANYLTSGFANAAQAPSGASLDLGSGEESVEALAPVSGLQPNTLYHYRLVVDSHCKPAEPTVVCLFRGPEATLRTFSPIEKPPWVCPVNATLRSGPARFLPDCRAYEMVSPVDKSGANAEAVVTIPTGYPGSFDQSAFGGGKITYSAYRAFAQPESAPYASQYIASRSDVGWSTEAISPPREGPMLYLTGGLDYQFKAFTADLCSGWVLHETENLLASGAIEGYPNLYRRDNCGAGAGTYEPMTKGLTPGVEPHLFFPVLQGFAVDGSRTFFMVSEESPAPVYESRQGEENPVPICILPNESPSTQSCSVGTGSSEIRLGNVFQAVSADGSRIYWSAGNSLYVRVEGEGTVLVSTEASRFIAAAGDGSKVVYLGGPLGNKLFEFDLETEELDLIAEGVQGVAGTSSDASVVYFTSNKDLGGDGEVGKPNLYRASEGVIEFIATLGPDALGLFSPIAVQPLYRASRVAPDGDQLVFMSRASLTDYDNLGAQSGEPVAEVFIYDDSANGGAGALHCLSCNPTGARPTAGTPGITGAAGYPAAAYIPTWTNQLYAPRVISDDGSRVYFNSFDGLVARDVNGKRDVYQWEAVGSGKCEVGGYGYVASAGGCVNLISSGESPQHSEFVDSSADGDDIFFRTYEGLYAADPGFLDIYDARIDGGFAPPPVEQDECKGEGCQPPGFVPPQDPTPPSALPSEGNPPSVKAKKCPKGKHRAKRKGKIVCVKNKRPGKGKKAVGRSRRTGR